MVYYLRFLKPPKFDPQKCNVRALVTVTTDLGEDFYPGDLTLHVTVVTSKCETDWQSSWQTVKWRRGMRTAWVDIGDIGTSPSELLKLIINTQQTLLADRVQCDRLPDVLSARSESFARFPGSEKKQAEDRVERRYMTEGGQERSIYEETGNSIARHIWDAGTVLVACLNHVVLQADSLPFLSNVLKRDIVQRPKVIELGSGCGIVGLEVAQLCTSGDVLLTDLPAAMDILNYNISNAKISSDRGRVTAMILDWDKPLPDGIASNHYDLIIVSDCTYNCDSIPALVRTLAALTAKSPAALITISMKMRHDSEAIFFDLMAAAELIEIDHIKLSLPDRVRQETEQSLEAVDVYVYGKGIADN